MEENKIVTRSIRAEEATLEQFKKISESFPSQSEAFKELVNMYELDAARAAIPGSADMLDAFRNNLDGIQKAFIYALELKQNAEERAQEAVHARIEAKEKTIADLQAKSEAQKAEIETLRGELKEEREKASEALKNAQNASEALTATKSSLADKTALIDAKNDEISRLKEVAESASATKKENETLKAEISVIRKEKESAERDLQTAKETAERAKKESERDLQIAKETAERAKKESERDLQIAKQTAENDKRAAVLEAKEEAQKKIDAYVAKIESRDAEIAHLKEENAAMASMREEIERLKLEITNWI